MVARFLITTADERSWQTDRSILFLGEWCRLYHRRKIWESLDAEVVPYHWDDRQQIYKDYGYLQTLYEDLLLEISTALNQFHGVDHSLRYWRILIGPWLGYFTQILFDRWVMIQRAVATYTIEGTVMLDMPPDDVIPNDMADFHRFYIADGWNHYIYGRILQGWTQVNCEKCSVHHQRDNKSLSQTIDRQILFKLRLRRLFAQALSRLSMFSSRSKDAFLIASYLPLKEHLKLQVALGQFPTFWRSLLPPAIAPVISARKAFKLEAQGFQGFEQCIRTLLPEQIPTLYLEGYTQLQEKVAQLPWPQHPKLILTANSDNSDDFFKAWAAQKVEKGCPLVIGQHGGHYGTGLWSFSEQHQLAIGDRYLTWGWTEGSPKHIPVGSLKLAGRGEGSWNPHGGLLLVTCVVPRYSYWMYSIIVSGQYLDYLNDQFSFAALLPSTIRRQVLVRLYCHDYGWSQVERWRDRHPDIHLNLGQDAIGPLIQQSRLYVATYNATTFLETLGRNIPTIMFWNPNHWELRPSAQPYFDRLKQVGIFHETPESAAAQVAEVWNDVPGWWHRAEVQAARKEFCDRFVRTPKNQTQVLKKALIEVIKSKKAH